MATGLELAGHIGEVRGPWGLVGYPGYPVFEDGGGNGVVGIGIHLCLVLVLGLCGVCVCVCVCVCMWLMAG